MKKIPYFFDVQLCPSFWKRFLHHCVSATICWCERLDNCVFGLSDCGLQRLL